MNNKNLRLDKECWQNFANEIIDLCKRSGEALTDYQDLLPKSKQLKLKKAIKNLDDFRSDAESEMGKLMRDSFDIWYPGPKK